MNDVAARVRAARCWKDLDQDELAEQLGLERQSIVRTENGRRNPKRAELLAIASICDVPADFMTGGWQALGGEAPPQTLYAMMRQILAAVTRDEIETAAQFEQELEEQAGQDEPQVDDTEEDEPDHGEEGPGP